MFRHLAGVMKSILSATHVHQTILKPVVKQTLRWCYEKYTFGNTWSPNHIKILCFRIRDLAGVMKSILAATHVRQTILKPVVFE